MSPKDATATKKSSEPKDLYDELTQEDQDRYDEIAKLGYTPYKGSTGMWLAKKRSGKNAISVGPANNLRDLLSRVQEEVAEDSGFTDTIAQNSNSNEIEKEATTSETSPAGDGFLFPGMKPTDQQAFPELVTAILNYESYKRERVDALAKEVEAKDTVVGLMRGHKQLLAFDPKTGIRSYRVNDYIEELIPGEEKLKSRKVDEEGE